MHWIWSIISAIVFIALLVLGVQAIISLTWSFGWLAIAVVIALIFFEVLEPTSAIGIAITLAIIIVILNFLL